MKRNTLSFRIISRLLPAVVLIGIAIFTAYYLFARRSITSHTAENAQITAKNTVHSIEQIIKQAQMIPSNLAWMVENGSLEHDSLYNFLEKLVENNPLIYASAIAFQPGMSNESANTKPYNGLYSPYAYRNGKEVETINLGSPTYDYLSMDWYQIPAMTQKPYWSEPYFDQGGANAMLSTYSYPFYINKEGKREFAGIITIDLSLEWLTKTVNSVQILKTGYAFLISGNGVFVTHPNQGLIMNHTIFTRAIELQVPVLRQIGREMINGKRGSNTITLPQTGKNLLYYEPLSSTGWSLGILYPHKEMYASLLKLNILIALLSVIALLMLVYFTFSIINRMLRPLTKFAHSARLIAQGNFYAELPQIKSNDEMNELRDSFDFMQRELAQYIVNLKETTSAKEKIESELRIAKEIQMGMIPHIFPPFPQLKQIDLYAVLESAKEVGGDLYDFFLLDQKHLCFAIGDVSGKGIPASLFMAVTRTLLRSLAHQDKPTSLIVSEINATLCLNNDSNMFVTFFIGILDTSTGKLRYCNAGHNPPVLTKKEGHTAFFDITKGIPLGLFGDFSFTEQHTTLSNGDKLFLYTDGLTEAENSNKELFSDSRLLSVLQSSSANSPANLVRNVLDAVNKHVNGNEQSDDLTMLSILFHGVQKRKISLDNQIEQLKTITNWIKESMILLKIPDNLENTINLVVEEAFSNIVFYAYEPGHKGKIDLSLDLEGEFVVIELKDNGKPFDPTLMQEPDTSLPAQERPIGGLGVFLMKKMTDYLNYRREDQTNILTIKKKTNTIK